MNNVLAVATRELREGVRNRWVFSATLLHLPVSTTHVVSGSIMGVGSAQRVKAVHWSVARQMVTAWVMTIPCTAVMGALSYVILTKVFF